MSESASFSSHEDSTKKSSTSLRDEERRIRQFWSDRQIYEKTLEQRKDAPRFVFYEGPPTANGMPHPGHCLTRAIKDLYPRYKTMRGFLCNRKAGWDTHGLPVEVEVCKELGIHSKEEIEKFGIEPFIHHCQESVFRYVKQWEELTERLGFWLNLDEAYITYQKSYVESVWWSLKQLFDRGLLYQGHKIVWWWSQGGTALSAGEVGQGYREVADPSVFVRFPLISALPSEGWTPPTLGITQNPKFKFAGVVDLLVWTTTPWTLPSNQFAAVHPELDYSLVQWTDETGVVEERLTLLATALVEKVSEKVKKSAKTLETFTGRDLIGLRYTPPFSFYYDIIGEKAGHLRSGKKECRAWRVVEADFVTTDSGTGIVHMAPAFGEADFDILQRESSRFVDGDGPELICCVKPDGKFSNEAPTYEGRWVKEADKDIIRDVRAKSLLFHQEQYLHDYPFCWRSDEDPLIQYPRKSWFIRTTQFKEAMLENNQKINWFPEHIKNGRFGNFLESNVDWALSRERYWGTPLPVWVCEETGKAEAIGSYQELLKKPGIHGTEVWTKAKEAQPNLCDDLKVHKPYIDAVTYDSPFAPGKRMKRVTEVIDCWYDSGAMPFAQWGFPYQHGSVTKFRKHFPADFISEAIDQTRGWFYSLLAISTMIFDGNSAPYGGVEESSGKLLPFPWPHPYKNCIVLGLMLGEDGQKMSKSKRNYREPTEIFEKYGADALRWYFYANQTPWTAIRYNEQAIKESMPEFLLRLLNVVSFYEVYSEIDGFYPLDFVHPEVLKNDSGQMNPFCLASASKAPIPYRSIKSRPQLDQWILSELNRTIESVTHSMDTFDHFAACGKINQFVDALSNWYVRRSRDRFWTNEKNAKKWDAYWTLYECLVTLTKLIAPFTPFVAESIWQRLTSRKETSAAFGNQITSAELAKSDGSTESATTPLLESVHLADYPVSDVGLINEKLAKEMGLIREIVSLGRSARMIAKQKVRQPLPSIKILFTNEATEKIFWNGDFIQNVPIIQDELNLKNVEILSDRAAINQYVTFAVLPDFKKLGPKLGKQLPEVKKLLSEADGALLMAEMEKDGKITLKCEGGDVILTGEDVQIRLQAKSGWTAAQGISCVVVLSTELTDDLIAEGKAREIVRMIQDRRKEMKLNYTDQICIGIKTMAKSILSMVETFGEYIKKETLGTEILLDSIPDAELVSHEIDGDLFSLSVLCR
ncbi:MAG: isoleucine--tRNA ligase [Thermoguttaceae bacterium]